MLCLFFGEDSFRSHKRFREFVEQITSHKEHLLSLFWFNADNFAKASFEELMRTENLFGGKYAVICEGLLNEAEAAADFITENLENCADSGNIFIFREEILEPSIVGIFKKHTKEIEEFKLLSSKEARIWLEEEIRKRKIEMPKSFQEELMRQCGSNLWHLSSELERYVLSSKKELAINRKAEKINVFHITDAIAEKDRSRAWLLFQKALFSGMDPEEIFWRIVWQIKNLLLIKQFLPASEKKIIEATRLHPYVVKKTVSASRFYTKEELSHYSSELIDLYHNARRGLANFDTGIEKFLIKL